jgi:phosphate transport system substrate-binding protein
LKDGQAEAKALDYVPLPDNVVKQIQEHWSKELGSAWKTALR